MFSTNLISICLRRLWFDRGRDPEDASAISAAPLRRARSRLPRPQLHRALICCALVCRALVCRTAPLSAASILFTAPILFRFARPFLLRPSLSAAPVLFGRATPLFAAPLSAASRPCPPRRTLARRAKSSSRTSCTSCSKRRLR